MRKEKWMRGKVEDREGRRENKDGIEGGEERSKGSKEKGYRREGTDKIEKEQEREVREEGKE